MYVQLDPKEIIVQEVKVQVKVEVRVEVQAEVRAEIQVHDLIHREVQARDQIFIRIVQVV